MKTIRLKSEGYDVFHLQQLLRLRGYEIYPDGIFGQGTATIVKKFQTKHKLVADGIVGEKTWNKLIYKTGMKLSEVDYKEIAENLGIEVAAVKAVKEVESGKFGGFLEDNNPPILFEGHIFWNRLKRAGMNPEVYAIDNRDILYSNWTKQYYMGGMKEYDRLNRAMLINRKAALESASWGMFQIMGFNYKSCGCNSVEEFVQKNKQNERSQLELFMQFIKSNNLDKYLREKDWAGFACKYNGPEYKQNKYDEKLEQAYLKYKKEA